VQCPTLAIVAQGSKQLVLGDEAFTNDPGHYLVVSLDLPVSGRVTAASKAKPFLGMSLDLDVKQIPSLRTTGKIQRATKPDRAVCSTIGCTPSRLLTFPCIQAASAGKSSTGLRATATTPAPTESKHRTIAPPIPRDPPVTSARLPFNSFGSFLKEIICNLRY
jgi:AraC-type transcriptional regulator N-terminus